MLTYFSDRIQSIPDLAASLSDRALEVLAGMGGPRDSVAVELELWHTMTVELERERLSHTGWATGRDTQPKRWKKEASS